MCPCPKQYYSKMYFYRVHFSFTDLIVDLCFLCLLNMMEARQCELRNCAAPTVSITQLETFSSYATVSFSLLLLFNIHHHLLILPCFERSQQLVRIGLDRHDYIFSFERRDVALLPLAILHDGVQ